MSFDDTRNGDSGALQRLLTLLTRPGNAPPSPSSDPIAGYQAMIAQDARLPKSGGLFGGDYARFMADAAATAASGAPSTSGGLANAQDSYGGGALLDRAPFNPQSSNAIVDRGLAGPADGAELLEIGNPANRRLRREMEIKTGRPWPRDPETGRNHDVAHIKAIADGGTNTLNNIRSMHPAEHLAEHMANGDFARWGRRAATARAFGGTVASELPLFDIFSAITGILSGRLRTDSFDNFSSDYMNEPSKEDQRKTFENWQKQIDPNWKPGDLAI